MMMAWNYVRQFEQFSSFSNKVRKDRTRHAVFYKQVLYTYTCSHPSVRKHLLDIKPTYAAKDLFGLPLLPKTGKKDHTVYLSPAIHLQWKVMSYQNLISH